MKKIGALFLVVMLLTGSAFAANNQFFLKIDGIEGTSRDSNHKGWIDVSSFSTSSKEDGKRKPKEIMTFKHEFDKTTLQFQQAMSNGTVFPECVVEICSLVNNRQKVIYILTLKNVVITNSTISTMEIDGMMSIVDTVELRADSLKWNADPPGGGVFPPTGDSTPLLTWFLLLAASCAILICVYRRGRSKA